MKCIRPSAGFTIIELMVTVAIIGIIGTMGVLSLSSSLQDNRLVGQVNSLVSTLNYARSEAINRSAAVQVCASADNTTCMAAPVNWGGGWIVLANGVAAPLTTAPALGSGNTLTTASGSGNVTFLSTGLTAAAQSFNLCDSRGRTHARDIEVSATGRVQSSTTPGKTVVGQPIATCP